MNMKSFLLTLAAVIVVCRAALAADPATPTATASNAPVECVPGMTAPVANVCELPGFHWEYTTTYVGSHDDSRSEWMLLPNK